MHAPSPSRASGYDPAVEPNARAAIEGNALDYERRLLSELVAGSEHRTRRLAEIEERRRLDAEQNELRHTERLAAIEQEYARASSDATLERDRAIADAESSFASSMMSLARKRETVVTKARTMAEEARNAAHRQHDEAIWLAESVYEGAEGQPRAQYEQLREEVTTKKAEIESIVDQAAALVRRSRLSPPPRHAADEALTREAEANPTLAMTTSLGVAQHQLNAIRSMSLLKLFRGPVLIVPWMLVAGASVAGVGFLRGFTSATAGELVLAGVAATALVAIAAALLWFAADRRMRRAWAPLARAASAFTVAAEQAIETAAGERAERERALEATREAEIAAARSALGPKISDIGVREADSLRHIEERIPAKRRLLTETRDRTLARARAAYEEKSTTAARDRERDRAAEVERVEARRLEIATAAADATATAVREWRELQQRTLDVATALEEADAARSPAWTAPSWRTWTPPRDFSPVVRVGDLELDLASISGALPAAAELAWALGTHPPRFALPVNLAVPRRASLLIETGAEGRDQSISTLQAAVMRLLAGMPPGKVHLVVVDPVGLGQSFAGFMHLADSNARLVTDRIWTESRHIEQRLTDLTEHMETVIQKYLRDEFPTIRDYNEQAGELAEPYRFLVVADYPANFSEPAATRLNSIVSSGARCGVFTLLMRDVRRELPPTADLALLRRDALRVEWRKDRFVLAEPELETLPLRLDPAPPADLVIPSMRRIGEAAVDSMRVEVPFSVIAPAKDRVWSESCSSILRVPLGRSGATKLQSLILGEGTRQHALIAGKTGSGKSTLLHALITNTALWYGPDEVEMYLVDFKKGVEFKAYAEHKLPHARAIAIESDREFGLSVLQGLDAELKRRGDLFRDTGVQDLRGFREAKKGEPMPRVLLIVDEFQELFVDDDKVAQESSLLLDRLVRQGRAFGMHVILGSQTLGGAYSLPRTTMGQMAVRIALQCNEADAQLILSDDNTAARLLSRPGEAIYNDAGGLVQGNSPFQIVWLSDTVRDEWLDRCAAMLRAASEAAPGGATSRAAADRPTPRPGPIVFEGNVPADLTANPLLARRLEKSQWTVSPTSAAAPAAWLGDAISIKDPTSLVFRRQSGANAVIVGQQDDAATALMAASIVSLAAQLPPSRGRFTVMDGLPADDPRAGALERISRRLPHPVEVVGYREVDDSIRRIAAEVAERNAASDGDPPSLFVFVHALHRFRQLRRSDDDFGFGGGDAAPSVPSLFAAILRDGPGVGVHVVTWVDTLASLQRCLDRSGLREFDQRVIFQLSATDSSTLIDSPVATKLGANRAVVYSEEQGTLEKFRPYHMPPEEWFASFAERLHRWASADRAPR